MSAYQPHDTTDNNVTATQQSLTHHSRNTMDKIPSIGSVNSTETPGKKKFDRKKLITAYILFSADVSESFSQTWVFFFIGNAGPEDHDGREPWGQVW